MWGKTYSCIEVYRRREIGEGTDNVITGIIKTEEDQVAFSLRKDNFEVCFITDQVYSLTGYNSINANMVIMNILYFRKFKRIKKVQKYYEQNN